MFDAMPDAESSDHDTMTVLRGAAVLVETPDGERVLSRADIGIAGGEIRHIGPVGSGKAREVIDLHGRFVLPGFISLRSELLSRAWAHPATARADGRVAHRRASRVEYGLCCALARLLRSGVTTVVECGGSTAVSDSLAASAGELGLRLYHAPSVESVCGEQPGEAGNLRPESLDRAVAFVRRWDGLFNGRVRGLLSVGPSVSLCAAASREIARAAQSLRVPLHVEVAADAYQFHERLRSSGATPVQWLHDQGLLGPATVLSGCQYLAGRSGTAYPGDSDMPRVAASGASICLTPLADAHAGLAGDIFESLRARGITVGLGVNRAPWDMFDEMRALSLGCKFALGDHAVGTAAPVLLSASRGGARALGRDDLGRIAVGAAADLVVVDLQRLRVGPCLDPARAVLACADAQMVEHVLVAGRFVVKSGRVVAWDEPGIAAGLRALAIDGESEAAR